MAVIDEIIRMEQDSSISFGNYLSADKKKYEGFEVGGNLYKVKTHNLVTRLEKNGALLLESVPGAAIHNLKLTDKAVTFTAEGFENTQITMELEAEKEYKIIIDNMNVGSTGANLSGKISFSVDLSSEPQSIKIEKL